MVENRKHLQLLSRITLLDRVCQNVYLFNLCCMFFSPPMSFQGTQKLFTRLSCCFKRACNLWNIAFNVSWLLIMSKCCCLNQKEKSNVLPVKSNITVTCGKFLVGWLQSTNFWKYSQLLQKQLIKDEIYFQTDQCMLYYNFSFFLKIEQSNLPGWLQSCGLVHVFLHSGGWVPQGTGG